MTTISPLSVLTRHQWGFFVTTHGVVATKFNLVANGESAGRLIIRYILKSDILIQNIIIFYKNCLYLY